MRIEAPDFLSHCFVAGAFNSGSYACDLWAFMRNKNHMDTKRYVKEENYKTSSRSFAFLPWNPLSAELEDIAFALLEPLGFNSRGRGRSKDMTRVLQT